MLSLCDMNNSPIFAPVVPDISNHGSNHQPRLRRSDGPTRKDGHPAPFRGRGPRKRLLPGTHSVRLLNPFLMRTSNPQLIEQLTLASPELRAYVASLQADSDQLHHITDYSDPGEAVTAMTALGESLIRYAGNEDVTGHENGPYYIDTIAGLFVRIGEGIAYQQRAVAAQKRVA